MNTALLALGLFALGGGYAYASPKSGDSMPDSSDNIVPTNSDNSPPGFSRGEWTRYDNLFQYYGRQYDIDWKWMKAICLNESTLGKASGARVDRTPDGSGIMQIQPGTASDMAGREVGPWDLINSDDLSIQLATKYIAWLRDRYFDTQREIIMSYNQGAGNTKKGYEYASGYYATFVTHLQWVNEYA